MAQATAASGDVGTGGTSLKVKVQRFGSYVERVVIRAEGEGEEAAVDALVAVLSVRRCCTPADAEPRTRVRSDHEKDRLTGLPGLIYLARALILPFHRPRSNPPAHPKLHDMLVQ